MGDLANLNKEEPLPYRTNLNNKKDYNNTIALAEKKAWEKGRAIGRKKGRAEGIEIGIKRGIEKGKKEIVKNLLIHFLALPDEPIAHIAGVSVEIIAEVRKDLTIKL